ncbi:hypothetical protein [Salinispira pacifica]
MKSILRRIINRIVRGYARLGRSAGGAAGGVIASVAGAVALSALIVFPLWSLATENRPVYNLLVLGLVSATILTLAVRAVRHRSRSTNDRSTTRGRGRGRALTAGALLLLILALYGTVALYWNGILAVAIPATVVVAVAIGYLLGVRPSRTSANVAGGREAPSGGSDE